MASEEQRPLASTPQESPRMSSHTPLPAGDEFDPSTLNEPRAPFLSAGSESPRDSSLRNSYVQPGTPTESGMLLANKESMRSSEDELGPTRAAEQPTRRRRNLLILIALLIIVVILIAVIVPVYFTVIKPKTNTATAGGSTTGAAAPTSSSHPKSPTNNGPFSGGDGSTVRASNGSTFTYVNKLGGIWYYDPNHPYSNNAYPNSWTPPLNRTWDFSTNRIYGVNVGGWFVLEPFITPTLYQKYPGATDEWTLSTLMAADTAGGGLSQLETHYQTFMTEDDFAEMASAGLNWVRIPIPFWAIDKLDGEPFLSRTCWKYILQALQWCRKYGLRVKIDLHTAPGSQNGYNHSGKGGLVINFLRGTMGLANAQRMLNYIRIFAEFFSQPEWKDVIVMFGIMNEPIQGAIGEDQLRAFNYEAYRMIREISGVGVGNGPYISIHDSFLPLSTWVGSLTGADRVALDSHPYFAFDSPAAPDPIDTGTGPTAGGLWPGRACTRWASAFNTSRSVFGVTIAGEFSGAINDCGLFMRGVSLTPTFAGGCAQWEDSSAWSDGTKAGLMRMAMASMDALGDWFFWTWKIAPSQRGIVESPAWSYQLGLRGGWMPKDPRTALGTCGAATNPFVGYESWMTGGVGAGTMRTTYPWPPASINLAPAATGLPTYTTTGAISTLPVPTYTDSAGKPLGTGNGWFAANDNTLAPTPIAGCTYPDPWDALSAAVPAGCGFGAAGAVPVPVRTSTPGVTTTTTRPAVVPVTTTATTTADPTTPTDIV